MRAAATAMARCRKLPHLHGQAEQSVQQLAAGILEHQHGPSAVANELKRTHRPRPVQLVLQFVFTSKAVEGGRGRLLRRGQYGQYGGPLTVGVALSRQKTRSPSSHKTWRLLTPPVPNQGDGSICAIRRQVEGRRWVEQVLSGGGQRSFGQGLLPLGNRYDDVCHGTQTGRLP